MYRYQQSASHAPSLGLESLSERIANVDICAARAALAPRVVDADVDTLIGCRQISQTDPATRQQRTAEEVAKGVGNLPSPCEQDGAKSV
jgi:hypothetical protein